MKIECLVFDVDGTIVNNAKGVVQLFQDNVKEFAGKHLTEEEVLALWGPPGDEIFRNVLPSEVFDIGWNKFVHDYREIHPLTGFFAEDHFIEMKKHIPFLAIFTGKARQTCKITLDKLRLNGIFDLVFTGNDVTNSKPYPEALFKIIGILQLKKDEVLFLGDSHLDIQAGKSAGIKTAGALWGSLEPQKLIDSQPDYIFKTPKEFRSFIFQQERSD